MQACSDLPFLGGCECVAAVQIKPERDAGIDFVDVLSAGTTGSGECERQVGRVNEPANRVQFVCRRGGSVMCDRRRHDGGHPFESSSHPVQVGDGLSQAMVSLTPRVSIYPLWPMRSARCVVSDVRGGGSLVAWEVPCQPAGCPRIPL